MRSRVDVLKHGRFGTMTSAKCESVGVAYVL